MTADFAFSTAHKILQKAVATKEISIEIKLNQSFQLRSRSKDIFERSNCFEGAANEIITIKCHGIYKTFMLRLIKAFKVFNYFFD